jgi:DNA helicase-2/ATP-dependent DNA helicase PcrA
MDTHLAELNDLQKKAATTTEGPVMIIAGAGTGKTKTVTHRMLHLMRLGVPGHKILGITFTNKAAREMRERMYKMLGKEPSARIWEEDNDVPMLKTFHSLGVHLLKIFHKEANLPKQFTILDSDESMDVIKDCMAELSIDTKTHDARTMRTIISNEKNKGSDPAQLEATSRSPVTDIAARIWHLYEQKKTAARMVDFDDLLTRVLDLLEHHTSIREAVQMMWDYVHVDEYQDTNHIQ